MLENLTESQRSAVEHVEGPLLILAGAGTGKTRTLAYRIAHLIQQRGVLPKQIMAVTFTRKAAAEMASRLRSLLHQPSQAHEIRLGTFHALSGNLLRESGEARAELELLPESDQLNLITNIIKVGGLTGPDWQPLEALRRISLAKGRLLSPDELASEDSLLSSVYRSYQEILQEKQLLDFDDLIGALVRRWEEAPEVLSRHQLMFRMILVDEFQDLNEAQYRWLRLLAGAHRNLCAVGDANQSIYGFRGSNVHIFQRFQQDFPEVRIVKLEQNFRSSQHILKAAGEVIAHNDSALTCKLRSDKDQGPLLRLGTLADEVREACFVVAEIERLLGGSSHYQIYRGSDGDTPEEEQFGFGDFAVLYRTHAQSRALVDALSNAGIPFQVVGEKAPFANTATDALLSYLRLAMDTCSARDLQTVFNLPPRGLGDKAQQWLKQEIRKGLDPWEILRLASKNLDLPVRHQAAMDRLLRMLISLQKMMAHHSLPNTLDSAWEETGLSHHCGEDGAAAESFRWLRLLAGFHLDKPAKETLPGFMADLAQWRAGDFYDPRADAVALMTMHAAKGLEFPVVFLCGLDQDLLPLTLRESGEEAIQEERRLFYVAMTRAQHLLVLSTVRRRFLHGEIRNCKPSQFISEIPAECLEPISPLASQKKKTGKEKQLSLF
ncbi:MAG: ATP-dependent helicase [Deltaproteobacteria bacterium]|nr:MAG: ATP-dependent helicase [Deltaproteobacteria bacterium]